MFRVTREIEFCYGHRLLDYAGKCRHLHGHNGTAVVTLEGPTLDKLGMVVDFTDVKRVVGKWIDETLDHTMILHEADPMVPVLRERGERFVTMPTNPTAENIAKWIFDHAKEAGLPVVEVRLWETPNCYAAYGGV